jgi:hypothetical protein
MTSLQAMSGQRRRIINANLNRVGEGTYRDTKEGL